MRTRLSIKGKSLDNNDRDQVEPAITKRHVGDGNVLLTLLRGFLLCLHVYDALKRCAALHNSRIHIIVF